MNLYIDINSRFYPQKLRNIKNAPKRLYYKGNLELLNEDSISIIGSRRMSDYGEKVARKFAKELALRDIVVVSGMAIGIDRVAHEETLNYGGKTIAVLGSGFNRVFPKENIDIYHRIIENRGLVISEYEANVEPCSKNFPARNRIVSGLSKGVLVVEAAHRSGTSITAKIAKEQGRNVYAIPGRIDLKQGTGVNRLICNGAKMVVSVNDILEDFPILLKREKRLITQNVYVKKEYRKIYNILGRYPMSLEEISLRTNNDVRCTIKLLTLMEIEDLVEQIVGVGYIRKQ